MISLEICPSLRRPHDLPPLGGDHLQHHPLVGDRTVLVAVVLHLPRLGPEAPQAVVVQPPHTLDGVGPRPVLLVERVEPVQRGPRRFQPGAQLLGLLIPTVVAHADRLDQRGQGEALEDEGGEDDRERQEDDEIALREGRTVRGEGDGEGRGQRHRAAHAAPAADEAHLPARAPGPLARAPIDGPDHVDRGHDPDQPADDDHTAHRRRVAEQCGRRVAGQVVEDGRQLEPDEDEEDRVQEEVEALPDG